MKQLLTLLVLVLVVTSNAQVKLTTEEWRKDLQYLQHLINTQYDHLYHRVSKEEFNKAVENFNTEIPALETHEVIVGFAKLIALFKVGHTGMPLIESRHGSTLKTGFHTIPINLYHFNDGVFVQGIHRDYAHVVGAQVLRIGNQSIEEALHSIRPVVSIENEQFFKAYGISMLSCPEVLHALGVIKDVETIPILFKKEGKEFTIEFKVEEKIHTPAYYGLVQNTDRWIESRNTRQTPLWLKNLDRYYHFEYIESSRTVYVRQSQIQDDPQESIGNFYARVFDFVENNVVEKFILDLRMNGGGNNYKNKPIILGLIKSKVNEKGKLFTIIGRRTFSAAQNLVNELEKYTETTFIGEPTAENVNFFGDVKVERLPISQLEVGLSFMWWQDNDPRDQRLWTEPEIYVDLSSEDYASNSDPILQIALNYQSNLPKTMLEITAKYEEGAYETAEQLAFDFKRNIQNKYASLENNLNALGYKFIHNNNLPGAVAIFTLNTKLYPESPNTWDSLAEAYLNASNIEKAIFYYQKALSMDPDGRTGAHAQNMLNRIKTHSGKN